MGLVCGQTWVLNWIQTNLDTEKENGLAELETACFWMLPINNPVDWSVASKKG